MNQSELHQPIPHRATALHNLEDSETAFFTAQLPREQVRYAGFRMSLLIVEPSMFVRLRDGQLQWTGKRRRSMLKTSPKRASKRAVLEDYVSFTAAIKDAIRQTAERYDESKFAFSEPIYRIEFERGSYKFASETWNHGTSLAYLNRLMHEAFEIDQNSFLIPSV